MTRLAACCMLILAFSIALPPSIAAPTPTPAQSPTPTPPRAQPQPQPTGYSASALYNLANAYARAGKPGLAVLNYGRARLLDPNDPDIEANLRHVREASGVPAQSSNEFERRVRSVSPQILSWSAVVGLLLAGISVLARYRYPTQRRKLAVLVMVGISFIAATVCSAVILWPTLHEAVVTARTSAVRVSPVTMGDPLFALSEAQTVRIRAQHDGFVLVQTQEGRTGWVPRADLAPIVAKQ